MSPRLSEMRIGIQWTESDQRYPIWKILLSMVLLLGIMFGLVMTFIVAVNRDSSVELLGITGTIFLLVVVVMVVVGLLSMPQEVSAVGFNEAGLHLRIRKRPDRVMAWESIGSGVLDRPMILLYPPEARNGLWFPRELGALLKAARRAHETE